MVEVGEVGGRDGRQEMRGREEKGKGASGEGKDEHIVSITSTMYQ